MYAIVNTGGKQYKVATDDVITVEKIEGNEGDKVTLPVIFLNDGKKIVTDPDKLAKAKVTAQIVEQFRISSPTNTARCARYRAGRMTPRAARAAGYRMPSFSTAKAC